MDISSRDFEAQPSHYLRRAEAGETIVVTDQGRAIAELRPIRSGKTDEAALLALARSGMITPPSRPRTPRDAGLQLSGPSIAQSIVEGRKDRF